MKRFNWILTLIVTMVMEISLYFLLLPSLSELIIISTIFYFGLWILLDIYDIRQMITKLQEVKQNGRRTK